MRCWPFIWPFLGLSCVNKYTISGSFSSEGNVKTIFHPVSQLQDWSPAWFINMMQRAIKYSTSLKSAGYTHGLHTSLIIYLWVCFGKRISRTAIAGFTKSSAANITYRHSTSLFVISWFNEPSAFSWEGRICYTESVDFFLSGHSEIVKHKRSDTQTHVPVDCLSH